MWKLQSQVGKQEREKEAWFDQTLIPSEKSHVDGDPSVGAPYPTHTQINARLACFWWLFGIFQKEEEDDGSAKLNHWNWYTKAPLCGFTSKYLKKHEMRAQEKAKRKLGDIGEPWVEDKGHDQTVFSDEYFASVPGVWQMKWTLHWLPSTRLGKKTHSLCFHFMTKWPRKDLILCWSKRH